MEHKAKGLKAGHRQSCVHTFIAAFFTPAERRKQAKMSITETQRVYAGLTGKEPACCPPWSFTPGCTSSLQSIRAGTPCDVREYTQVSLGRSQRAAAPWSFTPGWHFSLQSLRAGTPCDVLAAPLEALLLLFLRKVGLRKVSDIVPKATLLASSASGPLHPSTP